MVEAVTQGGRQKLIGLWAQTNALHRQIVRQLKKANPSGLTEVLEECQSIAIDIGNYIESYASEDVAEFVHVLEDYCEQIYQISAGSAASCSYQADVPQKTLENYEKKVDRALRALKIRTEVVFLPYKSSMWDALESIWRAAAEDSACDVYVVPIPYCDRNQDGTVKEWHYEGGMLPEYVTVTDYRQYSMEERMPDLAYIHNPYDGYNLVTSVAQDFYSSELKKYVKKLVYVPYYYAGSVLSDHQNSLPSLGNMDYIILPGEAAVDAMAVYQPREKLLPLGSPKIDRMLLMDGHGIVPDEWKALAQGKKIVLYNVGLSPMLQGRYRSLEKMRVVFNAFKARQDVLVWWRPHPLIKATLHAVAPELVGAYEELEKEFLLERIGIYDTGADGNLAVASADAFIGDYSSMVYLFGVTGKPIFYVNQRILTDRALCRNYVVMMDFDIDDDGNLLFVSGEYELLCRFCMKTGAIDVIGRASAENMVWEEKTSCREGDFVWTVAKDGKSITRQKAGGDACASFRNFPDGFYPFLSSFVGSSSVFSYLIPMQEWIYLFPGTANMVLKVHKETGEIRRCDWDLPYMEGQRKGTEFAWGSNYVCAKKYDAHTIVAVTAYDYSILVIDTCTDKVRLYESRLSMDGREEQGEEPLERVKRTGGIACEDGLCCCLSDFLDDLTGGESHWSKERQLAALTEGTRNLDGTCGRKVHEQIMKRLKEEYDAAV